MPCVEVNKNTAHADDTALLSVTSVSRPIVVSVTTSTAEVPFEEHSSATSSFQEPGITTAAISTRATDQAKFAGINIAGFDFGCSTNGTCVVSGVDGAVTASHNGTAQMQHFVEDDKLNIFRLNVGWQYLTNNVVGGTLHADHFASYDELMQGCLATGAYCVLDIHNYARWNGDIIGQGGPTNQQFAALWTSLATKFAADDRVIFGIMNEPHNLDIDTWVETVQTAVTAIRTAGATTQYITLPGTNYQSAGSVISDGSAAGLLGVTNPDGTTDNLILDVHQYLDSNSSGTSTECVTDHVADFTRLAQYLRSAGRTAILSETGGGNTASCGTYVCQELEYLNENSDVFLGYIGWAAGSFSSSYALHLTPTESDGVWTDTSLVTSCFSRA